MLGVGQGGVADIYSVSGKPSPGWSSGRDLMQTQDQDTGPCWGKCLSRAENKFRVRAQRAGHVEERQPEGPVYCHGMSAAEECRTWGLSGSLGPLKA